MVRSLDGQLRPAQIGLGVALVAQSVLALDPALVALDCALPPGPVLELWLVTQRSLRQVPRIAVVWQALEEGLQLLGTAARRA